MSLNPTVACHSKYFNNIMYTALDKWQAKALRAFYLYNYVYELISALAILGHWYYHLFSHKETDTEG